MKKEIEWLYYMMALFWVALLWVGVWEVPAMQKNYYDDMEHARAVYTKTIKEADEMVAIHTQMIYNANLLAPEDYWIYKCYQRDI